MKRPATRPATRPARRFLLSVLVVSGAWFGSGCASGPTVLDAPHPPAPSGRATGLAVIVHGADGSPEGWPLALARRIEDADGQTRWAVDRIDWYEVTTRKLSAPRNGYLLGRAYGDRLAAATRQYRVLHLVGHSLGAHYIQGIADAYVEASDPDRRALIHLTFLDAFTARGLFSIRWGVRRLGRNADYAESYVTTSPDPAFLTNALLRHAHNWDITATAPPVDRPSSGYLHNWPVNYYLANANALVPGFAFAPVSHGLDARILAEIFPAGEVTIIDNERISR